MNLARTRAWSLLDLLGLVIIVASIGTILSHETAYAWARGQNLSDVADHYGEANDVRAGEAFADNGFRHRKGLPEISYGKSFDHDGGTHDLELCQQPRDCVYLHNPPGSAYAVGFTTILFGKGQVFAYRLLPLLVGLLSLSFLAIAFAKTLGVRHAAAIFLVILQVPMFTNMMHGLCYHGYWMSLWLAEIGVLALVFLRPGHVRRAHLVALAALAFVNGWFDYEAVFLVSLSAIPFWLLSDDWKSPERRRDAWQCLLACCAGFGLAHVLHIMQVASYLGGLHEALADLARAGKKRTGGNTWMKFPVDGLTGLIFYYWFDLLPKPSYLNFSFLGFLGFVGTGLSIRRRIAWADKLWAPKIRMLVAIGVAILISTGWIAIMQQHAGIHGHFLPRLYCLVVLVAMISVSRSIVERDNPAETEKSSAEPAPAG